MSFGPRQLGGSAHLLEILNDHAETVAGSASNMKDIR